jgi:uncharacterized protein involved in response to NO
MEITVTVPVTAYPFIMNTESKSKDAYRIFFPAGIAVGIAGVSIWPLYYYGATTGYSGRAHMFIQSDCFLYAFIVGFLWTALPRFTGTEPPPRLLQYFLVALLSLGCFCFEFQWFVAGHLTFLIAHLAFITTVARGFARRKTPPPPTFALVGLGLLAGLLGAVINTGIALQWFDPGWDLAGRRLLTEGMVLLIVLGVGGFLGPRLLGFAQLPNLHAIGALQKQTGPPLKVRYGTALYAVSGFVIIFSVLGYGYNLVWAPSVRALVGTGLICSAIRPWRKPAVRSTLAWCVWAAHWFLIVGMWAVALIPKYRIDFLHIEFIGGFTLLILAVSTRVALSHGGYSLQEERRSWALRLGLTTGCLALLARLGAPFAPPVYFGHLAWAAISWISGISIWGVYLLRRILRAPGSA